MNAKKGILMIPASVCFSLLLFSFPVSAEPVYSELTDKASIEDRADILEDNDEEDLLDQAAKLSEETGFEIRMLTIDDADGLTTQEYAEKYFESLTSDGPDDANGEALLIDMDNREFYVATYGEVQYYLTDDRVDDLLDNAYEYASDSDFSGVFRSMLDDTQHYYSKGIADGTMIYNEDTGKTEVYHKPKEVTSGKIAGAALAGLIGFLATFLTVKGSYSMKLSSGDGFSVRDNVRLNLTGNRDLLVNHFVRTRHIPRSDSSGGSDSHGGGGFTTTHTTSGGYSAGGGGRKF